MKIIGIGELKLSSNEGIITHALGSCLGVCFYDPTLKLGGLLHALLPHAKEYPGDFNPAKYVDTGIKLLLEKFINSGSDKNNLIVKVAGGAKSFCQDFFNTGAKNIATLHQTLKHLELKITASDIGGTQYKTIWIEIATGKVTVKSTHYIAEL